jgi:HAD superfamily hydrolase (TIGR01509 family)
MSSYLFDFDGTLVDSMPVYGATILRVLDENGATYPENIVKIVTPLGLAGTAEYFIRELGVDRPLAELVAQMTSYMVEAYTHRVPAKPHVAQTLRALRARGDRLNVLTASPHTTLDPCLKRLGLYNLFDHVWSCEDFATSKADPAIYHMAAERMGVPVGEVIFLDDNYNADLTAKNAGARVFGVFDESSADMEGEIRAITERYVRDFTELL